jgi:two-component system sensor histidine kinase CpxA
VRNAIRHTVEGTAVEISLQTNKSSTLLRVRDHGPGVPDGMLQDIFLPFHRIANADAEGAGLGLAIAERAVDVHRGTIRATNAQDGGLIVEIALRAACD